MNMNEFTQKLSDPAYQAQLLDAPKTALRSVGIEWPDDVNVNVVRNDKNTVHIVIPPSSGEGGQGILDDELADVSAGEIVVVSVLVGGLVIGGIGAAVAVGLSAGGVLSGD